LFPTNKVAPVWWSIAVLALGVRLAVAVVAGGFDQPQVYEYDDIARALLEGRGFTYPHLGITYYSYAPPLYAWICAGVYLLTGGSTSAVLLVQMLVAAAHTVLVAALAGRLAGRPAGIASGLFMALHPGLIVYSSLKLHPLVFDAFFFTLVFWQFLRLRDEPTLQRSIIAGLITGLGMLSRATIAIFLPLGCLWLLATSARQDWPKLLGRCIVIGVCAAAVVAPWAVRNTLVHRQFVPFVTTDGEVLWRGNNPSATGHSYIDADHLVLDALPAEAQAELRSLPNEVEQSRWFRRRAVAFIEADPAAFVRLTLRKFFHFWWFAPQTGVRYPVLWLRGYQIYYVLALSLAVLGAWAIVRRGSSRERRELALLILFLISLSALQSLYYVEGRHRWAVEPLLLTLAGGGMAGLLRVVSSRGRGWMGTLVRRMS
jgi:4-amino-4-deoxy-L-arabinose transferase-like glycosyltransferase